MIGAWSGDLKGYADKPPCADWPGGARIAVSFVLNIEEGSERSVLAGDEVNESIYDMISEIKDGPDIAMLTNFAYGSRVGYWRIADLLDSYGVTCTINGCAKALEMAIAFTGSSPRVRGTRNQGRERGPQGRFIPARAGNAHLHRSQMRGPSVHPRACGERFDAFEGGIGPVGSSPRVRGTRCAEGRDQQRRRFIPARAGNA
jgi:hypothetical protein